MPYKDPERNKEAKRKSAEKQIEKKVTVVLPRSLALYEPMRTDMANLNLISESEYMLNLLRAELEKKGLWTAPTEK